MGSLGKYIKYVIYLVVLLFGLLLGYIIFDTSNSVTEPSEHTQHTQEPSFTCSMHPSVFQEKEGICPICGMDLVKVGSDDPTTIKNQFKMSERAIALANVQTSIIGANAAGNQILLSGEITTNNKTNATQTTLFDGRLDKLEVNFIGAYIKKGQRIGTIYSPELYLAQDKLLTSSSYKDTHEKLYAAARNTLGLWKLTNKQIDDLLKSGKPIVNFPLFADVSGTVIEILASEGNYFKQGDPLFKVAKLYSVWAVFQAYENQLSFLKNGQEIVISSKAFKGETVTAKISYIEPVLDRGKRIVSVRADIENKNGKWKPGMFIEGVVSIENKEEGLILVPKSAVLWTGERSVVYKKPNALEPVFEMLQVQLGASMGDNYVVLDGLKLGDEVVTNGAFTIDAAAQLNGKRSMMYTKDLGLEKQISHQEDLDFVSPELNMKLKGVLNIYFDLKNELVAANLKNAIELVLQLTKKLELIKFNTLDNDLRINLEEALKSLADIKKENSVESCRLLFKNLSKNFIFLASRMNGYDKPIYVQHCPMADNNSGADWLSLEKAIKNPYFGDKMLTCGSVVRIID
ncbi:efflux RND transporter periplasmic adaptor subunit [uncultured Maribacter sp.]|uniref:efflux RND transporter periplasmic adaptor subunit n=1 Tax=uncultured Maribacter sp. TaxID=431308 RepID=UPI0030DCF748|tara:strand:+ start:1125 stop:2843 length:1719 start_codon:yes stop_codon:yes gene_type:complete